MEGEGMPSKLKIFLGWLTDPRCHSVSFPKYKGKAWMLKIMDLLSRRKQTSSEDVKSLIGKLNHAGFIIPSACHFLNRIHWWFRKNKGRKGMEKDIPQGVRDNLALWMKFLLYVMKGILINVIVFKASTFWSCVKACKWD
eukprot:12074411-Ditylum_brightwellii.AAC.1